MGLSSTSRRLLPRIIPGLVFVQYVVFIDELLPRQTAAEAILLARFSLVDHVLKIPRRPGMFGNFELEQAETDSVLSGIGTVEHQDQRHAVRRFAVIER